MSQPHTDADAQMEADVETAMQMLLGTGRPLSEFVAALDRALAERAGTEVPR